MKAFLFKNLSNFVLLSSLCLNFIWVANASIVQLPDLVKTSDSIIKVSFSSNDLEYEKIGKAAFFMHGQFKVVKENLADYVIRISVLEDSSALVQISGEVNLNQQINSIDAYSSFLEALDYTINSVGKKDNLRGFFSGKFSFVGKRNNESELYISDFFFRKIRQITFDKSLLTRAKWSPSGDELIYTSYHKSGFPDLFRLDPNTGQRSIVSAFQGTNTGGVFSPSGNRIAMTLSVDKNTDLYCLNLINKTLKRVCKTDAIESNPSWSLDGKEIVFASDKLGQPQLYKVNSKGGPIQRIRTNISKYCAEPDWNPINKDLILFTASNKGVFQIALHSISEGKSLFVTSTNGGCREPIWLPDGRHFVCTERVGTQTRLILVDTISLKLTPLHSIDFGSLSGPAFSIQN